MTYPYPTIRTAEYQDDVFLSKLKGLVYVAVLEQLLRRVLTHVRGQVRRDQAHQIGEG
jgi:hypothetical protein